MLPSEDADTSCSRGQQVSRREHWEEVYARHRPDEVSWYQSDPTLSLNLIKATGLDLGARLLDVGGGTSILVDRLLQAGFQRLAVLDVSATALRVSQDRLGDAAGTVEWVEGDVLNYQPSYPWDLWHDRAVFHFLVDPADRVLYRDSLYRSVPEGGHVIVATFGPNGPHRCSGLDVLRCSAEDIARELGDGVRLVGSGSEDHTTPSGATQQFVYALLRRVWATA